MDDHGQVPPETPASPEEGPPEGGVAEEAIPKKKKKKEGLGTSRGIETMFRTSYRTHVDLSSLADNKANIMIGINGIIMSILIASISPKKATARIVSPGAIVPWVIFRALRYFLPVWA